MKQLTGKEIISMIEDIESVVTKMVMEKNNVSEESLDTDAIEELADFNYFVQEGYEDEIVQEVFGEIEEVYSEREGSDHDCMVTVLHFKEHKVYISCTGYYSSDNGTEYDEMSEVFPRIDATLSFVEKADDKNLNMDRILQDAQEIIKTEL